MTDRVRITADTEFEVPEPLDLETVHLRDLAFVLDVELDGDEVTSCTIDLEELVQAMTLYSSMEKHRHGWRRRQ